MNKKYNFKYYIVRSKDLAGFLIDMGNHIVEVKPNKDNPKYNVYVFLNGSILLRDIDLYREYGDEYKLAKREVIDKIKSLK